MTTPFNCSSGEELITPEYDQQFRDIRLNSVLDLADNQAQRDIIQSQSEDYTKRKNINFETSSPFIIREKILFKFYLGIRKFLICIYTIFFTYPIRSKASYKIRCSVVGQHFCLSRRKPGFEYVHKTKKKNELYLLSNNKS